MQAKSTLSTSKQLLLHAVTKTPLLAYHPQRFCSPGVCTDTGGVNDELRTAGPCQQLWQGSQLSLKHLLPHLQPSAA